MDDEQFERWTKLLEDRSLVNIDQEGKAFLVASVERRMKEAGYDDFESYFDHVVGVNGAIEWSVLIDRLTIHETRFNRHETSLDFISKDLLPDIVGSKQPPANIQVWSVGCATGEEAYTLAIILDKHIQKTASNMYFVVHASDISTASLNVGRKGIYSGRTILPVPAEDLEQYFDRQSDKDYKVIRRIRDKVCFTHANVMELQNVPIFNVDILYCQNMLIYFSKEQRGRVLSQFVDHMAINGYMVLGFGEGRGWVDDRVKCVESNKTLVYKRIK